LYEAGAAQYAEIEKRLESIAREYMARRKKGK
jgi:hypothetical protein